MIGFITTARHARELAAKDVLINSQDKTAAMYCDKYKARGTEIIRQAKTICDLRIEIARLGSLVPTRDAKGRFQRAEAELDRG